jgi:hypothetical protein
MNEIVLKLLTDILHAGRRIQLAEIQNLMSSGGNREGR